MNNSSITWDIHKSTKNRHSKATNPAITHKGRHRPTRFPRRKSRNLEGKCPLKEKIGIQNPHAKKTTTESLHPIVIGCHFKLMHPVKDWPLDQCLVKSPIVIKPLIKGKYIINTG